MRFPLYSQGSANVCTLISPPRFAVNKARKPPAQPVRLSPRMKYGAGRRRFSRQRWTAPELAVYRRPAGCNRLQLRSPKGPRREWERTPMNILSRHWSVAPLLAAPVLALALAAGAPSYAQQNPGVLVHAADDEPTTLDPAQVEPGEGGETVILQVYERLLEFGPSGPDLVPALATEVPTVENGGISADG